MKVMYWIMNMTFFSPQTLLSIPGWLTILPPILTAIIAIAFRLVLPMHVYVMYVCVVSLVWMVGLMLM